MHRSKPQYKWPITDGEQLKGEARSHVMKAKAGGKSFKQSKEPVALPRASQGTSDVHFGSHKNIEKQIGEEMRRLEL